MKSRAILKKIFASLLLVLSIFVLIQTSPSETWREDVRATPKHVSKWNGNLDNVHEITNITLSANAMKYVPFRTFIDKLAIYSQMNKNDFTVVIDSANDLEILSMLMNHVEVKTMTVPVAMAPTWYLSLNYVLGQDLTFTGQFIYPIGYKTSPFTGTFDGQGFTLQNMRLTTIDASLYTVNYSEKLEYISFFNYVSTTGVIRDLSIVDMQTVQVVPIEIPILYAAPVVGENSGIVENISVTSTGAVVFSISSQMTTSTLVARNTSSGIIRNSYVAVDDNYIRDPIEGSMVDVYPVVLMNEGTLEAVYFDETIFNADDIHTDPLVVGLTTAQFQDSSMFTSTFINNWYFNNSYNEVHFARTYPTLRGLRIYNNMINTYAITSAVDLLTFSTLVATSSELASRNFVITSCIDMAAVTQNTYVAPAAIFSGTLTSTVVSQNDGCDHNHDVSESPVKYHAIWNLTTAKATSYDITTYALLSRVSGKVENLILVNFVSQLNDASTYNTNVIYTGSVAGEVLPAGIVNNVHVHGVITIPDSSTSKTLGPIYVGGLVGRNSGRIANSTFGGQIYGGVHPETTTIATQNGLGGIVGFGSGGVYENLKNTARIIGMSFSYSGANPNTNATTYLGGILGAGMYASMTKVINMGTIISHDNSLGFLPRTYIGGIVSSVTNTESVTDKVLNQGDVRLMVSNSAYIRDYYAAGFGTLRTGSTTPIVLSNITNDGVVQIAAGFSVNPQGVYQFNDSFTNHNALLRESGGTNANPSGTTNIGGAIKLTGGVILDENTAASLHGIYQTKNQVIDLGILYRYAPVVYSLQASNARLIHVNNAENHGDLHFVTTRPMYNQKVSITGNTYGDYIFFNYLRNTGNMTIDITYASENSFLLGGSLTNYSSNLRISGLIGELFNYDASKGYSIQNSFNGGNITVRNWHDQARTILKSSQSVTNKSQTLQYMLYVSGIAFKNANTLDTENPTNVIIASTRKGGIHNVINDGNIHVDVNLYGVSRLGGITVINNGLISSAFNTGTIYNYTALSLVPTSAEMDSNQFEVEAGGITAMIGAATGQIMDSVNYGDVYCILPITGGQGWLNAAGIVGRNEKLETNRGNAAGNWRGKIQFTVNYGNVYAWNQVRENFGEFLNFGGSTGYIAAESSCKAAGIIAIGVINIINTANYGNAYSRYLAGGLFGLVDGSKFQDITSNVYIANSINYGESRPISGFAKTEVTDHSIQAYRNQFTTMNQVPSAKTVRVNSMDYKINPMYGGAIGYIYANNGWSRSGLGTSSGATWDEGRVLMLQYLRISFLINFDEQTNIIGSQALWASTSAMNDTLEQKYANMTRYMATTKTLDSSMYPFNSYTYVSSGTTITVPAQIGTTDYGVTEYTLSTNPGGIFHESFALRDGALDSTIVTNDYIKNYINFVKYEHTNKELVDKLFSTTDRIGIYALSSSKGILNGKYIPDNVEWGTAIEPGLDPIVDGTASSAWRGSVENSTSINYKFYKGMKQLEQSIATTVFDLQLVNVDNPFLRLDAPVVDQVGKTITYYVGDNEAKENQTNLIENKQVINRTSTNPTINYTNKTVTYWDAQNNVAAVYSYSTGVLVRIDTNPTHVRYNTSNLYKAYRQVSGYTAGQISNYYVTEDGGLTYRQATNNDRLFTLSVDQSGNNNARRYIRNSNGLSSGQYNYIENGTGSTYRVIPTEYTSRSTGTHSLLHNSVGTGTYPNYYYIGTTIPSKYMLHLYEVDVPNQIEVISYNNSYYNTFYTVNTTPGTYLLAEGAKLSSTAGYEANKVRVAVPGIINPGTSNQYYTSSIRDATGFPNKIRIYSEAGMYDDYEIRIVRTPGKYLQNVEVDVNGTNTYTNSSGSITLSNGFNKTSDQTLDITFGTINLPDNQDLMIHTQLKRFEGGTYVPYPVTMTNNRTNYQLTGGIVYNRTDVLNVMTGEYEPASIRADGTFKNATVKYQLKFGNLMASGTYRMSIDIGSASYYIQFAINQSNVAFVESFEYDNNYVGGIGSWMNPGGATSLLSVVRFDANVATRLDAMKRTTAMPWNAIAFTGNEYLKNLVVSPYSTITSITVVQELARNYASTITSLGGSNYANDANGSRVYVVTYNLRAENNTTTTFIHFVVEALIDSNIQYVYRDGINQGPITQLSFVRTNRPVVKLFYDFAGIDFANSANFKTTVSYNYDLTRYPNESNGSMNNQITQSISIIESSDTGVTIVFANDVAAEYEFRVTYTRNGEIQPAITYTIFKIFKTNNTDSSLVRVLFNTESAFESLGTIVYNGHEIGNPSFPDTYYEGSNATTNQDLLTTDIYQLLSTNQTLRKIKSLPNRIEYNNEKPKRLVDSNNPSIVYNRYDLIGYVSKTDLTNFLPQFALPTGAVIYQLNEFNQPLVDETGKPILHADFIHEGSENFEFIHYRVYSEASPIDANGYFIPNAQSDNYTDYYIYIVDVSYNVYFNINFAFADEIENNSEILNDLASANQKTLLNFYRYEELGSVGETYPHEVASIISNIYYFFTVEDNLPKVTSNNHVLAPNSSGYFRLLVDLPANYTYTFTYSGDRVEKSYNRGDYFLVESKIFAYRYTITITIDYDSSTGDWGQHGTTNIESLYEN